MKLPRRTTIVRWLIAAVLLGAVTIWLAPQAPQAESATVAALLDDASKKLEEAVPEKRPGQPKIPVVPVYEGDAVRHVPELRRRLDASAVLEPGIVGERLLVQLDVAGRPARLELTLGPRTADPVAVSAERAPITPWSVLPPVVAIILAFATGRLVLSLGLAILLGGVLSAGGSFVQHTATAYFWKATLTDAFKLWILVFTGALIGLVGLATRAGGVQGIVDRIARFARGPRSAQAATAGLGVAVFFDDYANTILVGSTMRPLTDRLRVSREKLAYLVDSTSAPIAGLAIISTWIGYEVGLFTDLARSLGLEADGYQLFFQALPFRFYCIFALALVVTLLITGRDFGPMLKAERRVARTGRVLRDGALPLTSRSFGALSAAEGVPARAHVALVPIGLVLVGTIFGLLYDGGGFAPVSRSLGALFAFETWRDAFGSAEHSTLVLALSSLAGSAVLFALVLGERLLGPKEALKAYGKGVASMYMAVVILVLAWAIKAVSDDLGTSWFLVAGLREVVSPVWLPLVIFGLAAVVAFSTGTSWGTMGILIPTAVPLAWHLAGPAGLFVSMAAVLDGAIFGDHCSPLSDTTVMSSIASGSDHMDHVKTQVPYALTAMGVAALFGYLWQGLELPWAGGVAAGLGVLTAVVLVAGRDPRAGAHRERSPDAQKAA